MKSLVGGQALAETGVATRESERAAYVRAFGGRCGLWVEGDDGLLRGLRFNLYHLLQSAGRDGETNMAAKGLTGEGYEGHYFWDTET